MPASGFQFLTLGAWKVPVCPNDMQKVEQTEKSTTLFGSIREGRMQGRLLPPGFESQASTGSCGSLNRDP